MFSSGRDRTMAAVRSSDPSSMTTTRDWLCGMARNRSKVAPITRSSFRQGIRYTKRKSEVRPGAGLPGVRPSRYIPSM